jgi:TPR repeat protein
MCLDRLASIPPDHLLLIARAWIFCDGFNQNKSATHVTKVLEAAASKGGDNDESGWLLDKLRPVPEFGKDWEAKRRWIAEIMAAEASPWAQYYRGRSLWGLDNRDCGLKLLRQSAEAGYAPAMSYLGIALGRSSEDWLTWLRKAAELKDPDGLCQSASRVKEEREFELLLEAAARGRALSMLRLANIFSDRLSPVETATFCAVARSKGTTRFGTKESIREARGGNASTLIAPCRAERGRRRCRRSLDLDSTLEKTWLCSLAEQCTLRERTHNCGTAKKIN